MLSAPRPVDALVVILVMAAGVLCAARSLAQGRQPGAIPVVRLEVPAGEQAPPPPSLPVVRLDDGERAGDLDMARALSLTFSDALPVRDVLLVLFRGTPFSVVFDQTVAGTFVGELTDLTLRHALEAVLSAVDLDYEVRGRVIRVFPRRPQTRLFEVSHVDVRRSWQRRVRSVSPLDGTAPVADLTATVDSDFFQGLQDGVRALLSPSGRSHIDRKAGLVQVTDFADRLDQVGLYIESVTLRASRQIRLQAKVIEVTLGDSPAVDWSVVAAQAGVHVGSGAGIRVPDFGALMRAIGTFGSVRLIGSPQVLAMNNEPAVMRVGSEYAAFGPDGGRTADSAAGDRPVVSPLRELTLSITPQIAADGIVHMSVSPTIVHASHPAGTTAAPSVVEADTTMRVQDGETVVIAGLLREVAGSVPASGFAGFFGRREQVARRIELIILLTPIVVKPAGRSLAGGQ